jgi:hypothetical protein
MHVDFKGAKIGTITIDCVAIYVFGLCYVL